MYTTRTQTDRQYISTYMYVPVYTGIGLKNGTSTHYTTHLSTTKIVVELLGDE